MEGIASFIMYISTHQDDTDDDASSISYGLICAELLPFNIFNGKKHNQVDKQNLDKIE